MTDDLELRLRQPAVFAEPAESQRCRLVMAKAADEIARLRAENEALREALADIDAEMQFPNPLEVGFVHGRPTFVDMQRRVETAQSICRAALQEGSRHE